MPDQAFPTYRDIPAARLDVPAPKPQPRLKPPADSPPPADPKVKADQ